MLTDDILSFADRLVSQSGILAKVTDFVLGSLISKTIAKAQCWASGWWCGDSNCLSACGEDIVQGIKFSILGNSYRTIPFFQLYSKGMVRR